MQAVQFPARQSRTLYRHELRTLAYVSLDEANGGIVRNLSPQGVGVQAVAALCAKQRVRVRFELARPRLEVESQGEVAWADSSGQCGIRFVDLPAHTARRVKEWIFANLLDSVFRDSTHDRPIPHSAHVTRSDHDAGLIVSAAPRPVIQLEPLSPWDEEQLPPDRRETCEKAPEVILSETQPAVDWLSRPVSGRVLACVIDGLAILAALLLFGVIFLSVAHELPPWPLTFAGVVGSAIFVALAYWMLFSVFGGATPGARLARIAVPRPSDEEKIVEEIRLR
jgi:hypothetical protein